MIRPFIVTFLAALAMTPAVCRGQATLEGKVELPKTHFAPVRSERYEIVSKAGVLATDPPRAVVYLEGDFPKPNRSRPNRSRKRISPSARRSSPSRSGRKWNSRTSTTLITTSFPIRRETLRSWALSAGRKSAALQFSSTSRAGHAALRHSRTHAGPHSRPRHALFRHDRQARATFA